MTNPMETCSIKYSVVHILSALFLLQGSVVFAQTTNQSLANSDIMTMIKSGLPEETIVLSIQNSPSNLDTSPQTLVDLKKQGVSQKILNAMLKAQSSPATSAVKQQSAVKMVVGEREIFLKRAKAEERESGSVLSLLTPFGRAKGKAVFRGQQARLRVTEFPISFEASLPADVHPDEYMVLLKLKSKKDRREIETSSAGFSLDFSEGLVNAKDGFRDKDIVVLQFEEIRPIDAQGNVVYRVTVSAMPETGEYALFHQENYYDFSFDSRIFTGNNSVQR